MQNYFLICIALCFFVLVSPILEGSQTEQMPDTDETELESSTSDERPTIGNFWDLTKHAGGFRWLIFGVLVVGVFLISMKIYELIIDKRRANKLESAELEKMELNHISRLIAHQQDHMSSRLMATMLNVFQTGKSAETLHEEIANYIKFQHDRFGTFRTRIDFLSDTAGALGLLGTVWGMFVVFFSGNLDKQVILTGMGIALLTTLLGLVVSIFLNFFLTVATGIFNKRLDQIISKSDQLRFRLLEFTQSEERVGFASGDDQIYPGSKNIKSSTQKREPSVEETILPVPPKRLKEDAAFTGSLKMLSEISEGIVARKLEGIELMVHSRNGKPVGNARIRVWIAEGDGYINDTHKEVYLTSGADGVVRFNWLLGKKAGRHCFEASLGPNAHKDTLIKIPIDVKAGNPAEIRTRGNNQGGPAGHKLPKPLEVVLLDSFGNIVPGWLVVFEVTMGSGKLDKSEKKLSVTSDNQGRAFTSLTLDKEPGFNVVTVYVNDTELKQKFQAMGQEEITEVK
jgi:biopolymer transport protein ExbB/TolQ